MIYGMVNEKLNYNVPDMSEMRIYEIRRNGSIQINRIILWKTKT